MSLTDKAIEKIKEMIVSGELKPGDRVPKENDLAERLGLSRNSLREAVRALAMIRVLDVRQGDGTYVTSLETGLMLDALRFISEFQRDDSIMQMFDARRAIEPAVAALAAQRMPAADALRLLAHIEEVSAASPTDEFIANDLEFHRRIAVGTGNPVLTSLVESVASPTARARVWRAHVEDNAFGRTLTEHRRIAAAIVARDAVLASAAMRVHISGSEEWLVALLQPMRAKKNGR